MSSGRCPRRRRSRRPSPGGSGTPGFRCANTPEPCAGRQNFGSPCPVRPTAPSFLGALVLDLSLAVPWMGWSHDHIYRPYMRRLSGGGGGVWCTVSCPTPKRTGCESKLYFRRESEGTERRQYATWPASPSVGVLLEDLSKVLPLRYLTLAAYFLQGGGLQKHLEIQTDGILSLDQGLLTGTLASSWTWSELGTGGYGFLPLPATHGACPLSPNLSVSRSFFPSFQHPSRAVESVY